MTVTLKLGSLCSGYGGLDIAVENHFRKKYGEAETIWFAENDKNCSQVFSKHWEGIPNHGDIKKIDWTLIEEPDVLSVGFPCQPYSQAGNRTGSRHEKNIWEYIASGISTLRPKWVVLENVQGILSLGGPGVIAETTSFGYDCRWQIVRTSDISGTHRRARWFCLATLPNTSRERHGSRENDRRMGSSSCQMEGEVQQQRSWEISEYRTSKDYGEYTEAVERWERVTRPAPDELFDDEGASSLWVEWMMGLPPGWVTGHGLTRSAELKMLGNGVNPQAAEFALSLIDK